MLEVKGFRGFRFNETVTGPLDAVITPPYDVISPEERTELAKQSQHSLVHLILPEARGALNKYEAAAETMRQWIAEGVLVQDPEPSYYILRQRFSDLDGARKERMAFFGVAKLPEEGERFILGHERTFAKPVEDRLNLTAALRANPGAVFGLYSDPDSALGPFLEQIYERPPDGAAHTIDGVEQEYWRVAEDPAVGEFLRGKTLYIADGHHRFLTACTYRDRMRAEQPGVGPRPWDYVLMGFVSFDDPGLRIWPPHRLVPKPEGFDAERFLAALEQWFDVAAVPDDLPRAVESAPGDCVIGMAIHGEGDYLLRLRPGDRTEFLGTDRGPSWRDLDVAVLHRGIIERTLGIPEGAVFGYEKNAESAMDAARGGAAGIAFILRATRKEQIRACADAGEPMPQKSTYFFPKLPSGVAINPLF